MKFTPIISGLLAFVSVFGQQRVVLYEHFSNANCSSCGIYTPQLSMFVEGKPSEAVMIGYQVNTPYSDGIYNENKTDVDARRNLYGISGTPYTIMDGNYFKNGTAPFLNQAPAKHTARKAVDATFTIDLSGLIRNGNTVSGNVTITSLADNSADNFKAFVVFVERTVLKSSYAVPPGNNSETMYPYVMRKFSPDASGTSLFKKGMNELNNISINQQVPNVKSWDELRVVAFVQNTATNEVYQAAMATPGIASSVVDAEDFRVSVYPNPAKEFIHVSAENAHPKEVSLSNAIGAKVLSDSFTYAIRIPVSNLPQGIYFLSVKNTLQNKTLTQRIIIQ